MREAVGAVRGIKRKHEDYVKAAARPGLGGAVVPKAAVKSTNKIGQEFRSGSRAADHQVVAGAGAGHI